MSNNQFDYLVWIKAFRAASNARSGFQELRTDIWKDTVEIANNGSYQLEGAEIKIDNDSIPNQTEFFKVPPKLQENAVKHETKFSIVEADCLETANILLKAELNPCVLNMASDRNPGGGVRKGSGAQEENIFRRTNLFRSLFQFVDYAPEYRVQGAKDRYPLDSKTGGIYSGGITVFRASENSGYALLKEPYRLSFVSVPALRKPELKKKGTAYFIADSLVETAKEKIRTILRIAAAHAHESLVLSAFGCGAFANPPGHVALLFKEVFEEEEFKHRFRLVVFSIIDDHNSWKEQNPEGNFLPFLQVFG
ncbi:TIGR02452 family protein [Spirochaetia bacterium]|nr:TIGR02452 family protein [Spirochaetia bacterium]